MGIWEPSGKWRAEVLTDDQTGSNPREAERCVVGVDRTG